MDKIKVSLRKNLNLIYEATEKVKGWGDSPKKLSKTFKFDDFEESIKFVNKIAKIAEKQNHHPDIQINYNKVLISITDHEAGKVSDKCIKFVQAVDEV